VGEEDAPPGQQILNVPVAEIEAVIEPNGIMDDFRRKSVALVRALSGPADQFGSTIISASGAPGPSGFVSIVYSYQPVTLVAVPGPGPGP